MLLIFLSLMSLAHASAPIEIALNGTQVQFQIHAESPSQEVKFEKPVRSSLEGTLLFLTPEADGVPMSEVRVTLLKNFEGMTTLKKDIKAAGFAEKEILNGPKSTYEQKLVRGRFFHWSTPTFGSAEYFYLQSPYNRKTALRIGPIAGTVMKDFTFDWSKVKWSKR